MTEYQQRKIVRLHTQVTTLATLLEHVLEHVDENVFPINDGCLEEARAAIAEAKDSSERTVT